MSKKLRVEEINGSLFISERTPSKDAHGNDGFHVQHWATIPQSWLQSTEEKQERAKLLAAARILALTDEAFDFAAVSEFHLATLTRKPTHQPRPPLMERIKAGMTVEIQTPHGKRSGRVVMRGPAGFVLNMREPYSLPMIADETNIVAVPKLRYKRD
jgi:hypothetical protein